MTAVLDRLRSLFLAPTGAAGPAVQVAERVAPRTLGVLCTPADAAAAGAVVALAVARAAREPVAVVCSWPPVAAQDGPARDPVFARGPARRLAARLRGRGLETATRGRLVLVALPAEGGAARAAAERAAAAAGDAPVVVVVAGPRAPELDPLLGAQDRLVVVPGAGAVDGLEAVALVEAARLGRAAGVLRLPATGSARVALGGRLLTPAARGAVSAALEGHAR